MVQMGRSIKSFIIFSVLILSSFASIYFVSALEKDVSDFDKIWYDPDVGFNKNGQGTLVIAVTYTNNSFRTVDHAVLIFHQNPLYFSIEFEDELEIIRDSEGNIIYQEPEDGYLYFRKAFVDNRLPNGIKRLASKNFNYKTIEHQGTYWYRIYVPSFNRMYEWKRYNQPSIGEKWFTWGSNESILFETKAMFVELTSESSGRLLFDFSHPSDNGGQTVAISKSYLASKGIVNPYFEWGRVKPWKNIGYSENDTHYFISPEHFSYIYMHEVTSGDLSALCINKTSDIISREIGSFVGIYDHATWDDNYQTFNDNLSKVETVRIIYYTTVGLPLWINATVGITDSSNNWLTSITLYDITTTYSATGQWEEYDFEDIYIKVNTEYRIRVVLHWASSSTVGWSYTYNEDSYSNGHGDYHATYDYKFKLFGTVGGSGLDMTRIGGANTERNIVDDDTNIPFSSDTCVKIKIPVSTSVNAIMEVLNQTSMTTATEVNSIDELVNDTFYYSSADQFVYIGTTNLSLNQNVNWSVNCTYGGTFSINPPGYLRSGDNFCCKGVIQDADGNCISGTLATTRILYQNSTVVVSSMWNCTNGNYDCDIATTSLVPGIYYWDITFEDFVSGILFKKGGILYLDVPISGDGGGGPYASAHLYYTFFELATGTQLTDDYFKFYISASSSFPGDEGDRVKSGRYGTYLGQTLYYKILDYFNNQIYPPPCEDSSQVFYFDGYDVAETFQYNPSYATDGSTSTYAGTQTDGDTQLFTSNTCAGADLGLITKVEMRVYHGEWYYPDNRVQLRPIFTGGDGTNIVLDYIETIGWSDYYDITDDINSPGTDNWNWIDIDNLDSRITATVVGGGDSSLRLYKVEIRVTYSDIDYSSVFIDYAETYIDIGVNLNQFRVKNMNSSTVYFILRKGETQQVGRWIPPYEETEFFVWDGLYNLTVQYYHNNNATLKSTLYVYDFNISTDVFYWIAGFSLADIIIAVWNTNTTIMNQIINVGVYVSNIDSTVFNQLLNSNVLLQNIDSNITQQTTQITTIINNVETNITQQVNSVWFEVNNTNTTINEQANLIKQTITNTETNITTQINSVLQNVTNTNSTVVNQANLVLQQINNFESNLSQQVNSVWQDVNNTNSTVHIQLNTIEQTIANVNTNISTQANIILQNITNMNSSIYVQLNSLSQYVTNMNSSIDTQLNVLSQDIYNMNNTVHVQLNSVSQEINNFETNISSQVNSVWASINNSNSSIHYQLNVITADITNMNTGINTQLNLISVSIENTETNITDQVNQIDVMISNMETNITNQINVVNVTITNSNTSIMNQLNAVLTNIVNTNSTVVTQANMIVNTISNTETNITNQLNTINNQITNTESNITSQVNIVLTQITNTETNITTQLNVMETTINNIDTNITTQFNYVEAQISNAETNITNQINVVNVTITNSNTSIHNQMNVIISEIQNSNMSIINQTNLIVNSISNTETNITTQLNSVQTQITNTESNISAQVNIVMTQITNTETNITTQLNVMETTINNIDTNITTQFNYIEVQIANMESNLSNQINIINITIVHNNTNMSSQLNAILIDISNTNSTIVNQANMIVNSISNTETNIITQLNAVQTIISNTESNITSQVNIVMTQITNTETNITTQLNVMETTINNIDTNITTQFNYVEVMISNAETNITNQINYVNTTIINVNGSIQTQLNTIITEIQNTDMSIVDQINLIWNEINNTNTTIWAQVTGVHTTITTMWSNVNYSFSVIESDISYHNTTIINLIEDMNATLLAHLLGVLDNVSQAGVSVFDRVLSVLDNLSKINTSLHDEIIEQALDVIEGVTANTTQAFDATFDMLDSLSNIILSINISLHDEIIEAALDIIADISSYTQEQFNATIDFLDNMTNIINSVNTSLHDAIVLKALQIMDNMSNLTVIIIDATNAILENISNMNISINGSVILEILDLTQQVQSLLVANFSYIDTRIGDVSDLIDQRTLVIIAALESVNMTGYNDLIDLLMGILEQFELPHEWRIPSIDYAMNDTMPPISAISASLALGGGINVRWASTDNTPTTVSYVTIFYREGYAAWRIWKPVEIAAGNDVFDNEDETLTEGAVYWFKCIGVDEAGNVENESDTNICNITYYVREIVAESEYDSFGMLVLAATLDIYFWIVIGLLVAVLIMLIIRKKRIQQNIIREAQRSKRPIYFEETL